MTARLLLVITLLALGAAAQEESATAIRRVQSVAPDLELGAFSFHGRGADRELIVIGREGAVRQYRANAEGLLGEPVGELVLADADRSLVAVVDRPDGKSSLYHLSPRGLVRHDRDPQGRFLVEGERVASRARFRLRLGAPRFARIIQDVNGDGHQDLVIPGTQASELWLDRRDPETGVWALERCAEVRVKVDVRRSSGNVPVGDTLEEIIVIPDLDLRDVNGDGRDDIVIVRGGQTRFHRQREDGSFPPDPDVVLDLDKFRDTTPKASVRPGRTLAGTESARQLIRDLDGDGMPDYVVAHRRKVWVFHGDRDGPQFTRPSSILRTADDITGIWLADIDDDGHVDLLVLRVEVPSIGALIGGLFGSIEVDMRVLGYRSLDGREFDRKPTWNNSLSFSLPSLGEILKDPEAIIARFDRALDSFRKSYRADVDADGQEDLILLDEEVTRAEIYRGRRELSLAGNLDRVVREVFFEEKDSRWDLDRLLEWLEGLGDARVRVWTEGRRPEAAFGLREEVSAQAETVLGGDLDGDGADELIVVYRLLETRGRRVFDLWRLAR
ncbi:MAG: VCBS repeat-containing protein [Planctomycetes bacterium]|nr:VCBS repeat-containing protein [Planctomycetota bacterium]